jgi:hypothetical protein
MVLERLVDINTGKPLEIEIPDDEYESKYLPIRQAAWLTGARFRMGLLTDEHPSPNKP